MKTLSIDLECFSSVNLKKSGVYRYCESNDFTILLFGYSVDGAEVKVVDLTCGEKIPQAIIEALTDDSVIKWAFNATFERICLSAWLRKNYPKYFKSYNTNNDTVGNYLNPSSWKCSMIWSAYIGMPLSLEAVGAVLGLQEQKLKEGKDLIRYFCVPCKPTKTNGGRTRNLPIHDTAKWATFVSYNRRDVEVEMSIQKKLSKFPVPEFVWKEYHIDQKINDRGITIDMDVVEQAIKMDEHSREMLSEQMKKLTNLDNPNSVVQMKRWLAENGVKTDTLGKKAVAEMLKDAPQKLADVLTLRQQLAKSSIKKYQAMQNAICADSRARGMFQFYGANRSGRWSGRLIQLQNLPQNHMPDLEQARDLVKGGNYAALEMLYDSIPEVLSELIRTAFIPRTGYKFAVLDYSAIEARVLSHLAQESWRNKVFANNGDIYCASASAMFGVPVEKHGQNSHLRQKGKIAELALGYGGSVGALKAMGALDMGLNEEDLQPLVSAWRTSNPNIVRFWWDVDDAVKNAIKQKTTTETHGIYFIYQSGMLFIKLPSGRKLAYVKPKIGINQFGGESVTYEGIGATKKWERIESYGPKFVENIVQAISRDILSFAMGTLKNYFICGHVHDELIIECSMDTSLDAISEEMGRTPPWIKDLQLKADGYETMFYKKD
ncbi:DNA polymerase [Haloimpatiens sp. FM7315]|uniref:DNA polymerase n=1 Tax=Haloimpatiens sp. FM7315 TaxID=3298609 RepID=UPI0035A26231